MQFRTIQSWTRRSSHAAAVTMHTVLWLAASVLLAQEGDPALEIETTAGPIQGLAIDADVIAFKGIPYAQPPVGELRWQPPQAVAPWDEVRDTTQFPNICSQPQSIYAGGEQASEDCLYLNVWTAAQEGENLPVMFWIHGGAFIFGSGSVPMYDGANFARNGVVFVSLNYRLGLLGFLAHPDLSAENESGTSGNQGLYDQLAALQWVQDNIAKFGGDADNVTVFGESAGSMSVCYLVATPLSKGLFHKAIGQSGGCFNHHATLTEPAAVPGSVVDPAEFGGGGHDIGIAVAAALGEVDTGAEGLARLREKTPTELAAALNQSGRRMNFRSVYVDGHMFPDQMRTLIESGNGNVVPAIVGSNTNEAVNLFPQEEIPIDQWTSSLRDAMGDGAEPFIEVYGAEAAQSTKVAAERMLADSVFSWEMRTWARALSKQDVPSYLYVFDFPAPFANIGRIMGAAHAAEIQYVFNNDTDRLWNTLDKLIGSQMHRHWINFATSGDPNSDGLPSWPRHELKNDAALWITEDTAALQRWRGAMLDAWEALYKF